MTEIDFGQIKIARLLVRGRAGILMSSIAKELGITEDEARALWQEHSCDVDRRRRDTALALFERDRDAFRGAHAQAGQGAHSQPSRVGGNSVQLVWDRERIEFLLEAGRKGEGFSAIASTLIDESGLIVTSTNIRRRWQMYATGEDRAARALARANRPREHRAPARVDGSSAFKEDATPLAFEPPVGRPLREFPACTFPNDPRAARNIGSGGGAMPSRLSFALGGSSLAGIIHSGG